MYIKGVENMRKEYIGTAEIICEDDIKSEEVSRAYALIVRRERAEIERISI